MCLKYGQNVTRMDETSKTNDPRVVTVGTGGKVARFTQRSVSDSEAGFVRIDGKIVAGFVPRFGRGGKVFYAWSSGKNAQLAA